MFALNFEQKYKEDILPLKEELKGLVRFWQTRAYDEEMISTATPSHMRQFEQRLANDVHLADLAKKRKKK